MEENLDPNNEISDNSNKSNSEEIKEPTSEKDIKAERNNDNLSQFKKLCKDIKKI